MANSQRDHSKEHLWRQVLARHRRSGLTVRAFCEREALAEPSPYAWRAELARRDRRQGRLLLGSDYRRSVSGSSPRFVPVRVMAEDRSLTTDHPIEIVLPGGLIVRITTNFDSQTLAALLEVLESRRC